MKVDVANAGSDSTTHMPTLKYIEKVLATSTVIDGAQLVLSDKAEAMKVAKLLIIAGSKEEPRSDQQLLVYNIIREVHLRNGRSFQAPFLVTLQEHIEDSKRLVAQEYEKGSLYCVYAFLASAFVLTPMFQRAALNESAFIIEPIVEVFVPFFEQLRSDDDWGVLCAIDSVSAFGPFIDKHVPYMAAHLNSFMMKLGGLATSEDILREHRKSIIDLLVQRGIRWSSEGKTGFQVLNSPTSATLKEKVEQLSKSMKDETKRRYDEERKRIGAEARLAEALKAQPECRICMDSLKDKARVTPCGHIFCQTCIQECLKRKPECPLCKRRIEIQQVHPLFL